MNEALRAVLTLALVEHWKQVSRAVHALRWSGWDHRVPRGFDWGWG